MLLRSLSSLALGLALIFPAAFLSNPAVRAEDAKGAEEKPEKPEPKKAGKGSKKKDDDSVSIEVTLEGKTETFDTPAKAGPIFKKALLQSKRAKDKDAFEFEAIITLDKNKRKFTDPAQAQEVAQTLTELMKDLKRVGATFADVGDIPDAPTLLVGATKWDAKKIAEGQAEVQKRIVAAARQAGAQANLQQIQRAEIEKARAEGLIPQEGEGQPAAKPKLTGNEEERRKTMVEFVKGQLQETYGKGENVGEPSPLGGAKPLGGLN
ncbi:MAG: hypothetical protein IT428_13760 [Planctomycetaceae bacterium]|nr:hypothetical protein [Planctomycetaceae bacterium]